MPEVSVNINGDAEEFKRACKEAENSVRKVADTTAKSTAKAASEMQGKLGKAGQALQKVGGALGAGSLSGGPMAIAAAGGIAIATKALEMYDKEQQSAVDLAQRNADEASKASAAEEKRASAIVNATNSLLQYCSAEKVSNENKVKAIQLLEQMERRYGSLGIAIDKSTGKVSDADIAKAQKTAISRQMRAVRAEMEGNRDVALQYRQMSGSVSAQIHGKGEEYALKGLEFAKKNEVLLKQWRELAIQLQEVDINIANAKAQKAARTQDAVNSVVVQRDREYNDALAAGIDYAGDRELEQKKAIRSLEDAHGTLTDEQKQAVEDRVGRNYDQKYLLAIYNREQSLNRTLKVKQLELQGLTKEAELQKTINAEIEKKGRDLTQEELDLVSREVKAKQVIRDTEEAKARGEANYSQTVNTTYTRDRLLQMGERMAPMSINYPARTFTSVEAIKELVRDIEKNTEAAVSVNTMGVFG